MCVIFIANYRRPLPNEVQAAWETNDDGGGVAWREGEKVKWAKGLNLEQMQQKCADLPLPFVAHFRIASVGGPFRSLTHPFPVEKNVPLILEGETSGGVLFHNGHWADWAKTMFQVCTLGKWKIPVGRWSDSRAMAFLASHFGPGVLDMLGEKTVILTPKDILISGKDWSILGDNNQTMWASNTGWKSKLKQWWDSGKTRSPQPADIATEEDDLVDVTLPAVIVKTDDKPTTKILPSVKQPGGAAAEIPFVKTEQGILCQGVLFPHDIGNSYRREQISFDLVEKGRQLGLVSKKQFKKLERVRDKRAWNLARKLAESSAPTSVN